MNPTCDQCGSWIEVDNRRFAGFCSVECFRYARANSRTKQQDTGKDVR